MQQEAIENALLIHQVKLQAKAEEKTKTMVRPHRRTTRVSMCSANDNALHIEEVYDVIDGVESLLALEAPMLQVELRRLSTLSQHAS